MASDLAHRSTPEQEELARKRAELEALQSELAQEELNLATLENELRVFERRYLRTVGILYAKLDEVEAKIAEHIARLSPSDEEGQQRARQARRQAEETANSAKAANVQSPSDDFKPSEEIRALYRKAAKLVHPDLASDEEDRERRTRFMAEVNSAYEAGDGRRLEAILLEWQNSPESVVGHDAGAELVRAIRSLARMRQRLEVVRSELKRLLESDLCRLKLRVDEAAKQGRDLLGEMAAKLEQEIAAARARLASTAAKGATT